jgi:hypothetical protein
VEDREDEVSTEFEEEESEGDEGGSQPLDFNSEEIRLRIIESGTRLPDCIAASASRPVGNVRCNCFSRRKRSGREDL